MKGGWHRLPPVRRWPLGLAAAAFGCTEYGSLRRGEDVVPPPAETCNGIDDDGDGGVDEGFDADASGRADCAECASVAAAASAYVHEPACTQQGPSVDPWNLVELWSHDGGWWGCRITAVGDLDGDGAADVLCAVEHDIVALDGRDGEPMWTAHGLDFVTPTSLADVDADGRLEVFAFDRHGAVVCLDDDGTRRWTSETGFGDTSGDLYPFTSLQVATVAGEPLVFTQHGVLEAIGGATRAWLDLSEPASRLADIVVADLDLDGSPNAVFGWKAYRADGRLLWKVTPTDGWEYGLSVIPLQADDDAEAETVFLADYEFVLVDDDGTVLFRRPYDVLSVGLGCAGDLDGDGGMEVIFADRAELHAWSPWGEELWSRSNVDASLWTGCTVFDFDLDGRKEVLYLDEAWFYILDGATGEVHAMLPRDAGTIGDLPLVVDLDGDGSVEIVVSNPAPRSDEEVGVRVYSNVNRDWPPGTQIWPHEAWSGTGMWPDGTLQENPEAPWLEYGVWRGQPEWMPGGTDLTVEITDSCVAEADIDRADVRFSVRLVNAGPQDAPADVPIAVYGIGDDGADVLLTVVRTIEPVPAGWTSATLPVDLTRAQARGGLRLVAGDDGTGAIPYDDCATENNAVVWTSP